jgi:hypothetical protein
MANYIYEKAPLPNDVSLSQAETTLSEIIGFFDQIGVIPFRFPLPPQ